MKNSMSLIQSGRTAARVAIPIVWVVVVSAVYLTARSGETVLQLPFGTLEIEAGRMKTFFSCLSLVSFGLIAHVILAALICYIEKHLREYPE